MNNLTKKLIERVTEGLPENFCALSHSGSRALWARGMFHEATISIYDDPDKDIYVIEITWENEEYRKHVEMYTLNRLEQVLEVINDERFGKELTNEKA